VICMNAKGKLNVSVEVIKKDKQQATKTTNK
jgi:hypothetical protein